MSHCAFALSFVLVVEDIIMKVFLIMYEVNVVTHQEILLVRKLPKYAVLQPIIFLSKSRNSLHVYL